MAKSNKIQRFLKEDPFQHLRELAGFSIQEIEDLQEETPSSSHWPEYIAFRKGTLQNPKKLCVPILYYNQKDKGSLGYLCASSRTKQDLSQDNQQLLNQIQASLHRIALPPEPCFDVPQNSHGASLSLSILIYYIHQIYNLPLSSTWYFSGVFEESGVNHKNIFVPSQHLEAKYHFALTHGCQKFFVIEGSQTQFSKKAMKETKAKVHYLPSKIPDLVATYLKILSEAQPTAMMAYLYHLKNQNISTEILKETLAPISKIGSPAERYYAHFIIAKTLLHEGKTLKAEEHFSKSKKLYSKTLTEIKRQPISSAIPYDIALDQQGQLIVHQVDMGRFINPTQPILNSFRETDKKFTEYYETLPHLDLAWGLYTYKNSLARFLEYQGRWALNPQKIKEALQYYYYFQNSWEEVIAHGAKFSTFNNVERCWNGLASAQYGLHLFKEPVKLFPQQEAYANQYQNLTSPYDWLGVLQTKILMGKKPSGAFLDFLQEKLIDDFLIDPRIRIIEILAKYQLTTPAMITFADKCIQDFYQKNGIEYLLIPRICQALKLKFPKPNKKHYLNPYYEQLCKHPETIELKTPY